MKKREFLKAIALIGCAFLLKPFNSIAKKITKKSADQPPFTLPTLSYTFADLEPSIDRLTMEIHYTKHHQAYVDKLNECIATHNALQNRSLEDLFKEVSTLPIAIRNHGGGHYNHSFFWKLLSPYGEKKPLPGMADAIEKKYGSLDAFKKIVTKTALERFGSGWVWVILDAKYELDILSTPNQDNPLMDVADKKGIPLIALDIWEHAYYLTYQNRRQEYVNAFWNVLNWEHIEAIYQQAIQWKKI